MERKILISNDKFLYEALKGYFPNLEIYSSVEYNSMDSEYSGYNHIQLLIDNREPYSLVSRFKRKLLEFEVKLKIVVLAMRGAILFKTAYANAATVDMTSSMELCIQLILENMAKSLFFRAEVFMKAIPFFSGKDINVVESLFSGVNVKEISSTQGVSEKKIYSLRERICKEMGFSNFHQACIFIIQNNLHQK